MENAYYVTHPRIDKTGVVYAPATEKARTTFLDWLERNGFIRRAHRHLFRQDMVAERIEDPNVPADVVLHYGYEEAPPQEYRLGGPEVHDIPVRFAEPEVEDLVDPSRLKVVSEEEVEFDPETMGSLTTSLKEYKEEVPEPKSEKKRMPVQEVMLRGYVE